MCLVRRVYEGQLSPCPLVAVRKDFGLTYRDKDKLTPLFIHRAPPGTHERFNGGSQSASSRRRLHGGNFPLWLAPDQVRIITLNDDEALINYVLPIVVELRANMVRVDADYSATPIKAKTANAEQLRVHTMLVIGGRDMEADAVSVRLHHGGPQGAKPKEEVVADVMASIKDANGVSGLSFGTNAPVLVCIFYERSKESFGLPMFQQRCGLSGIERGQISALLLHSGGAQSGSEFVL